MNKLGMVLVLVAVAFVGTPRSAVVVDSMLGRPVFVLEGSGEFDTLGWDVVLSAAIGENSDPKVRPVATLGNLQGWSLKLFKANDCSAVAAAILHDQGFRVAFCSQWKARHSGEVSFHSYKVPTFVEIRGE